MTQDQIAEMIISSLERLIPLFDGAATTPVGLDTHIFGRKGCLSSLGLVTLIVDLEEQIQSAYGVSIALADERAMSLSHSPFRTVRSLSQYIGELLQGRANG